MDGHGTRKCFGLAFELFVRSTPSRQPCGFVWLGLLGLIHLADAQGDLLAGFDTVFWGADDTIGGAVVKFPVKGQQAVC